MRRRTGRRRQGDDYTSTRETLTFGTAQTIRSQTISVPVVNDTDDEEDETFMVTLSTPANATILQEPRRRAPSWTTTENRLRSFRR